MRLRILASALSCNGSLGSEPLVGFKIVEALTAEHDVTVISSPPTQPPKAAKLITCNAGPCVFNEIDSPALLRFEVSQWLAVRRMLRHERFDLVHHVTPSHIDGISLLHSFDMPMLIGPALASVLAPDSFRPFLSRVMVSSKPRFHPSRIMRSSLARIVATIQHRKQWFRATRAVIAGVPSVRGQLPTWWRGEVCDIAYSGVEHELFTPASSKELSDKMRLLFVGRTVPYKGVELILRSLALLGNRVNYEARFIGQSTPFYLEHCEQLARDLGIADRIRFEDAVPREHLVAAYQWADVFLMPSIETYGIALLEAMSCGLPSVVANLNGPGCILPAEAGMKIQLQNPEQFFEQFSAAIATLASNPELSARMGAAARTHVKHMHDWSRIGKQVRAFVKEAFAPKQSPNPPSTISNLSTAIQA